MNRKTFKILSIDGGGIRGIYSAFILYRIEEEFNIHLHNYFDLIAGTSTGAIIAAAIACNIPIKEVTQLYQTRSAEIFAKKPCWKLTKFLSKFFYSKFDSKNLEKILSEKFGDKTLKEVPRPLILPASNITTGNVYISKSQYDESFVRDKYVKVKDAVLASCLAPTYFNPLKINNHYLCDGGLWANNPSLLAVIDAKRRFNQQLENIKILSIGTGLYKPEFTPKKHMGLINGWERGKLVDFILSLQSQATDNYLSLLLNENQKFRINFESPVELPLDDNNSIEKLISKADEFFTYNALKIKEFLNTED